MNAGRVAPSAIRDLIAQWHERKAYYKTQPSLSERKVELAACIRQLEAALADPPVPSGNCRDGHFWQIIASHDGHHRHSRCVLCGATDTAPVDRYEKESFPHCPPPRVPELDDIEDKIDDMSAGRRSPSGADRSEQEDSNASQLWPNLLHLGHSCLVVSREKALLVFSRSVLVLADSNALNLRLVSSICRLHLDSASVCPAVPRCHCHYSKERSAKSSL